jgi:hypothetical protein
MCDIVFGEDSTLIANGDREAFVIKSLIASGSLEALAIKSLIASGYRSVVLCCFLLCCIALCCVVVRACVCVRVCVFACVGLSRSCFFIAPCKNSPGNFRLSLK